MPTGYTCGILDGEIKTFPEFAKTCMRAFGATIHMRDESMDEEYTPRVPSDYHIKALKDAEKKLKKAKTLSDKKLISERKRVLNESIKYYTDATDKAKSTCESLELMLKQVKEWTPPTNDHQGIKDFMIEQLNSTINYDGDCSYYEKMINAARNNLLNINPSKIRKELIADASKDIIYHTEEHRKEIDRCNHSNKWVTDLLESISQMKNEQLKND
jgi:hypothetical protein